jgi:DNA-binding NarL/FixJ family response regulator
MLVDCQDQQSHQENALMGGESGISIICLETQFDVWERAWKWLGPPHGARLIRCSESMARISELTSRLGSGALLSKLDFLSKQTPSELRELSARNCRILAVLQSRVDDELALPYIRYGCSGILHLDDRPEFWHKAVQAVASGEMWVSRNMLTRLVREVTQVQPDLMRKITRRESEIMRLICLGHDNARIAGELFISKETVRWHVRGIYSKLGVTDREGAIRSWRINGGDA